METRESHGCLSVSASGHQLRHQLRLQLSPRPGRALSLPSTNFEHYDSGFMPPAQSFEEEWDGSSSVPTHEALPILPEEPFDSYSLSDKPYTTRSSSLSSKRCSRYSQFSDGKLSSQIFALEETIKFTWIAKNY